MPCVTCVSSRTVGTDDALIPQLNAPTVFGARARFTVVRGPSDGVAIETFRAQLTVTSSRVMFADTKTWNL